MWTVRSGDDLWSIAAATLASSTGSSPGLSDIARYWQAVIALNRNQFRDPNLIFPGDRVRLPPIPPIPPGAGDPPN